MGIVDMHSSWLVINSIIGCTNACKYCILQDKGHNLCKPVILSTPEEAVKELKDFKFYNEKIPLCLFPNTDIFLNKSNIDYLLRTLDELEKNNITNDLILITKCLIPNYVIDKLKDIQSNGRKVVVYLSYSGLDKSIEPNIKHEDILQNFKNLKKEGIPIIHYYRPFIPQNSNKEAIKKILENVNKYTNISVTTGLMYVPTMLEKESFWEELKNYDIEKLKRATSIWPLEAWNYFYEEYDAKQNFYQTNTCALNTILEKPSMQYYGTYECKNFNNCSLEQRERCKSAFKNIDRRKIIEQLKELLNELKINNEVQYKFDDENGLELTNVSLDVKTAAYLSYMLGIKTYVSHGRALNDIYNSTLIGSKPLVLKKGNKDE